MRLAVVGLGLIGGSLALDLRSRQVATEVIGVDRNPFHESSALSLGIVDRVLPLDQAIRDSDVILLATPVDSLEAILPNVLNQVDDYQVVIDVGSTKLGLVDVVASHPKRARYVASHPMAGTEYSGPEAAVEGLFANKCCVICDAKDSALNAIEATVDLYESIGMNIVYHSAQDHDVHCAYVSHISHISSFALALTVLEKEKDENRIFELASGGFSSTVRLAKSSPATWIPIFEKNRDNVLDVLDQHINTISQFRTLLIKKDFEKFYQLIEEANNIQKIIK